MNETKFTPGPWAIKLTPSGLELQAGGGWLFRLDDGRKPSDEGSDFLETQAANLLLMEQAPELYEALEEMLMIIRENAFVKTGDLVKAQFQITNARAVLKKARGEQ